MVEDTLPLSSKIIESVMAMGFHLASLHEFFDELEEKYQNDVTKKICLRNMKRTWDRLDLDNWTLGHLIEDIEEWELADEPTTGPSI